ncbi:MAG: hypothetical protein RLZZ303_1773 [Candidatus Hydrogenedentota bacterium]
MNKHEPAIRHFWQGLAFWMLVGVLGVALRGVRWEEGFERAQALLGVVPYPDGHPLRVYAWNSFSIHYYSSALLLKLTDSALLVCGLRNLLCAWGAMLPLYILGSLLARRALAGHLATLLILANAHAFFRSYYSNDVWPFMFTSGELGLAWALLCVCAFAARRWCIAFFMTMAMPVVHVGQLPPVLALAGLMLAWVVWQEREHLRPATQGLLCGLAVSALFTVVYLLLRQPMPDGGGYSSAVDAHEVWKRFTYYEDIHRRPVLPPRFGPLWHSTLGMVAALALGGLWLWSERARGARVHGLAVLMLYATIASSAVGIAWGVQQWMGIDTPYLIIGWLPYRLTNHVAIVLLVLVAVINLSSRQMAAALAAAGWLAARPLLALVLPETFHGRYVMPSEGPLFLLVGGAMVAVARGIPAHRAAVSVLLAAAWFTLALATPFLAACALLGILVAALEKVIALGYMQRLWEYIPRHAAGDVVQASREQRDSTSIGSRWLATALPVLGLTAVAGMLLHEYHHRQQLVRSPFEVEMRRFFETENNPTGILLAPFWTLNYQEKTGQPVFATFETPLLTPYIRSLGPVIEKMLGDAYGIRWGQPWNYDLTLWTGRSPEEWRTLRATYGIAYVLAPESFPLALDPVLRGEGLVLYRMP